MNHSNLMRRIELWRWLLPVSLAVFVLLYQLILARWIHDNFSEASHFAVELLLFATAGPAAVFVTLTKMKQWVEEKEQAEVQARTNERWLASLTAASADAIISLNPQGLIESWNRGAELLFGYTALEVQGKPLSVLFGPGESADVETQWLKNAVDRAGFVRGHETTIRRSTGQRAVVEMTATQIADDREQPIGMSFILRDVSRRKQREDEIQRLNASLNQQVAERTHDLAEKVDELARANAELQRLDQLRTELVSLVSHQIRAPLTNIRGAVERVQADCGDIGPGCTRMCNIINEQVVRLDHLVHDVLAANRLESGDLLLHPEPMSVLPMVRQIVEQVRARLTDRPIQVTETPGLPLVYADRDRMSEVLANLLDNADKYTPPGTEISLAARADEETVTLSVRDHGPGLPPEALSRVFDKFYRAEVGDAQAAYGYGLGLYVCRRLVEAQNGRIWAENHPRGGAVFSFTLPVWQEHG